MDKRIGMNLNNWGIKLEELNEMAYEDIRELPGMTSRMLFLIMTEAINNVEIIREYMMDHKGRLI